MPHFFRSFMIAGAAAAVLLAAAPATAGHGVASALADAAHELRGTDKASGVGEIEVAYSPDGASLALVLKVISSAQQSIRLAAYSFTSPAVVRALIEARRRGVDVAVVADARNNLHEDRSGKGRQALNLLVNAGIPTRTISKFRIFHDKFLAIDSATVQTGSFNYSNAASTNSENVLVLWNNPQIARSYLRHWQDRYDQGDDYHSTY
jgi:phosphatidylserine/phosphatidylglycerophosphate/cardiolipin synthase-like enzyme